MAIVGVGGVYEIVEQILMTLFGTRLCRCWNAPKQTAFIYIDAPLNSVGSKYGRSVLVTQCCSVLLDTYYIRTHIFAHRSFKLLSPPTPNSTTEPNNHCVIHIWFLSSQYSFFRFVFVYVYIHNPPIMYTYIYDKFILLFRSLYFHFSVSLFHEYKYFFRVFCLITYINMILWLLN